MQLDAVAAATAGRCDNISQAKLAATSSLQGRAARPKASSPSLEKSMASASLAMFAYRGKHHASICCPHNMTASLRRVRVAFFWVLSQNLV